MAIETTTSCQLVQNFLVCAVETSRLHKLKSFGLIGRHSKLYCLCNRDIQTFVCAIDTFKTLLFVQSGHSKLYCLCNWQIQKLYCLRKRAIRKLLFACPFWGSVWFLSLSKKSNFSSKFDSTHSCSISENVFFRKRPLDIGILFV